MTDKLPTSAAVRFSSIVEQQRLAQILDEYVLSLEGDEPIAPEDILGRYPVVAERLSGCFSSMRHLHNALAESTVGMTVGNGERIEPERAGERMGDRQPSRGAQLGRWLKRHTRVIAIAASILLLAIFGVLASLGVISIDANIAPKAGPATGVGRP